MVCKVNKSPQIRKARLAQLKSQSGGGEGGSSGGQEEQKQ